MEFTAIIEKTPSGWYIGQCEQVPGALTQGKTVGEVKENLKEAITLVLEAERDMFRRQLNGKQVIRETIAMA